MQHRCIDFLHRKTFTHAQHRLYFTTEATAQAVPIPTPSQWEYANTEEDSCLWNSTALFSLQAFPVHQPQFHLQLLLHALNFAQCQAVDCKYPSCCLGGQSHQWSSHSIRLLLPEVVPALATLSPKSARRDISQSADWHPDSVHNPPGLCPEPTYVQSIDPEPALTLLWDGMWAITSTVQLLQKKEAHSLPQSPLMELPPLLHPLASAHFPTDWEIILGKQPIPDITSVLGITVLKWLLFPSRWAGDKVYR